MAKIAIIETGGKQYVVTQDSVIDVEATKDMKQAGDKLTFDKVLLTDDGSKAEVGAPYVKGAAVKGELVSVGLGKKLVVLRYRQKSRYAKHKGHRQNIAKVRITTL